MLTLKINGAKCIPCPIDGKNLNDCWEELFCEFTDNVIGGYRHGVGTFSFTMNSADGSLFVFTHERNSHRITFIMPWGVYPTLEDLRKLEREMKDICSMSYEACGTILHVVKEEIEHGEYNNACIKFSFYTEIDD